jgi:hypothetical protein
MILHGVGTILKGETLFRLQNLAVIGGLDETRVLGINPGEGGHLFRGDRGVALQHFNTYQVTPSLHGGVVNEPVKVKYPRSLGSRSCTGTETEGTSCAFSFSAGMFFHSVSIRGLAAPGSKRTR